MINPARRTLPVRSSSRGVGACDLPGRDGRAGGFGLENRRMSSHHGHRESHGHHHHDDHAEVDWEALGPQLERGAELRRPAVEEAATWLRESYGRDTGRAARRIVDVGSGPGVDACLFAQVFTDAEVVAVDGTPALLERATARAARLGLADRVRTRHADLPDGLDDIEPADVIWSSMAMHHVGDQRAGVARLARRLRPGGLLALVEGGLPARYLPRDIGIGRPGLQARLDAVGEDWFAEMRAALPDTRAEADDWPALIAAAGLAPASRTFLLDLPAPLGTQGREYLHAQLTRQREMLTERLDETDLATLDRLIDPDDDAGILRRPDAFLLNAYTVHTGRSTE